MTRLALILALLLVPGSASAQQPGTSEHIEQIRQALDYLSEELQRAAAALKPPTPEPEPDPVTRVPCGADLQAALNAAGVIELQGGCIYNAPISFTFNSKTELRGNGATVQGLRGPALYVPPSVSDVTISDLFATSGHDQAVIQLGDNDIRTQSLLEQVPQRITLRNVRVPTHRGKRAIEVNAAHVQILDCVVEDTWDPALRDSQAILIMNTPGPVTIKGGHYTAGSEIIMSGGDTMKLAGVPAPQGVTIEGLTLSRPSEWRTDGVRRGVKNLLELKSGIDVIVRDVTMRGHWVDAQPGYAIVITPKDGQIVRNVLFDRVDVRDTGAGFNILGRDYNSHTPEPLSGLVIRNSTFVTDSKTYGGNGWLAQIGAADSTTDITFENNVAVTDGTTIAAYYFGSFRTAAGTPQQGGKLGALVMRGNYLVSGLYGLNLGGAVNGTNWQNAVERLEFAGNTVTGRRDGENDSSGRPYYLRMRTAFPQNTYIERTAFNALFDEDWRLKP